jgi:glycosyltransferase involved in cell wall biosynthesis
LPRELIKSLYNDIDISLITIDDQDTYKRKLYEGPDERLKTYLSHLKTIETILVTKDNRLIQVAEYFKKLRAQIRNEGFDVIHIFELPPYLLPLIYRMAKDTGTRVVYHTYMPTNRVLSTVKAVFLERFADGIIASSPYVLYYSLKNLGGRKMIQVIPPPVDTFTYRPMIDKLPFEIGSDFALLYIGPLDFERFPLNHMINLISNLTHSLDIKLIVALAPRYRDDWQRIQLLRKMAIKRHVERNVELLYRRLSYREKIRLYSNVDAVIFPFLKSYKGAVDPPMTLLEAMACGGLAIATDAGSFPWVIKDGHNGFICPNCTQLSDFVKRALKMSEANKSLIRNRATKTIREYFSSSIVRNQILSFYDKVMAIG